MNRLAELSFAADGEINEEVALWVLERVSRAQLKTYLAAVRRQMRRRRVYVALSGGQETDVGGEISARYPGRELSIRQDGALGAGVKLSVGDDIVDASVTGYLKKLLEEIGKA